MFEYINDYTGRNRHIEFVRSIFVESLETPVPDKKDDLTTTLNELLAQIFDEEG